MKGGGTAFYHCEDTLKARRVFFQTFVGQLQFIMSAIIAGVNVGRLESVQMKWLPLVNSLVFILMLLLNFLASDVVMAIAPYITSMKRGCLTTNSLFSSATTPDRNILIIAVF